MLIGVPIETYPGERRVACVPQTVGRLKKTGADVLLQAAAGEAAGYTNAAYEQEGARLTASREEVFRDADVILMVRGLGANPEHWEPDAALGRPGQAWIGMMDPLSNPEPARTAASRGLTTFALELLPRITRAQPMDVLSSQANLAGYKAVLMAADALPRILPMMTTAAGTITPARVFVIGAGVAGLQAIATARRLGAVVAGYDVRPEVRDQIESLGARFVEVPLPADAPEASGAGGYAAAMDQEFYARQAELMAASVAEADAVVTTAAVPGRPAPVLITRAMVEAMRPGSVIVDLAAERGGNCEITRAGETVVHSGVTVIGPVNLPSALAYHASQVYARNVVAFVANILKDGAMTLDMEDEIVRDTLLTHERAITCERVRQALAPAEEA